MHGTFKCCHLNPFSPSAANCTWAPPVSMQAEGLSLLCKIQALHWLLWGFCTVWYGCGKGKRGKNDVQLNNMDGFSRELDLQV